jgi:DNA-binding winged helix-turn-helix (wHTH) protein
VSPLSSSQATVRFGDFQVDLHSGELCKHGMRIRLQVQPFQVLQMLLEHAGKAVTREELQKRIWPADTFVDFDQGLNNAVKRLREALGDDAETPRFIETIPKRGYRFIGSVEEVGNGAHRSLGLSADVKADSIAVLRSPA